jgi:hypothetical protein
MEAPKYVIPSTLRFERFDKNPWFYATKAYGECYKRYFGLFNNWKDWEEEIQRPEINTVCRKELLDLRAASQYIGYKEVAGYTDERVENPFLEEMVKDFNDF